jgi:hypothetical protein
VTTTAATTTATTATTASSSGGEDGRIRSLDERFAGQDQKIDRVQGALDQILTRLSGSAPPAPAPAADATATGLQGAGPAAGSIAAQVQAELDRRDDDAKRAQREAELDQMKATVAKLGEAAPIPPQRRIERFMWGGR